MTRFISLLKDINSRLSLPQPLKSQILLEIAGDLDELYEHYRKKGYPEEEALQLAKEKFDVSEESLSGLLRVHEPFPEKISHTIFARTQSRWELTILIISLFAITLFLVSEFLTSDFFTYTSNFIWPVLLLSGIIVMQSMIFVYILFIKKNPNIRKVRSGIHSILFFGVMCLLLGIFGYFIEIFMTDNYFLYLGPMLFVIMHDGRPDYVEFLSQIPGWYVKCSSLVMFSIFMTIFSGVVWHVLLQKLTKIEQNDIAVLMNE